VAENPDRPMAEWSDDQRGLSLPDVPTVPKAETVDWSGEAGGEDPGSGALPKPF